MSKLVILKPENKGKNSRYQKEAPLLEFWDEVLFGCQYYLHGQFNQNVINHKTLAKFKYYLVLWLIEFKKIEYSHSHPELDSGSKYNKNNEMLNQVQHDGFKLYYYISNLRIILPKSCFIIIVDNKTCVL